MGGEMCEIRTTAHQFLGRIDGNHIKKPNGDWAACFTICPHQGMIVRKPIALDLLGKIDAQGRVRDAQDKIIGQVRKNGVYDGADKLISIILNSDNDLVVKAAAALLLLVDKK